MKKNQKKSDLDNKNVNQHVSKSSALDDEQRIKVLSPGMLVIKRFVRNKLAITGLIIIIFMILFSFLGGLLMPYRQQDTFTGYEMASKEYALAAESRDYRFASKTGDVVPDAVTSRFGMAAIRGEETFENRGDIYSLTLVDDELYTLNRQSEVARAISIDGSYTITLLDSDFVQPDDFEAALDAAISSGMDRFETSDGTVYYYTVQRREYTITAQQEYAVASKMVYDMADPDNKLTYDFMLAAELAYRDPEADSFEVDGATYTFDRGIEDTEVYLGSEIYAVVSTLAIQEFDSGEVLSLDFKMRVREAIDSGETTFTMPNEEGTEDEYTVVKQDMQWTIRRDRLTYVKRAYEAPSAEHPLGLDANGMDSLTRLMYGGRISLTIGVVVVFIEVVIGIILGGMAGYFGKWIDNLIMRIVDIFNCIPAMPLYIILGSVMDEMRIDPNLRIYYLMLVLGLLGWPSIARLVRGQILSLREQEFMTATEATGIKVRRRIFRHLIPNVIPQLIVISTMTLGSTIITESTLSFLGLGVKYPMASWGNIITAVSDPYVMTTYTHVWIPAGFLILLTVLGFNFIGDGLRDAFDPKMKR